MAEIKIDGNTHFAGTQGVGKSTIQRAILFFYNADQMKLGISKEKKSFSEYYFEHPNSYIIYEVMRDNNLYMVVTFINRGKICFRFVDTAYKREYFIDSNNEVYADWSRIRNQMPGYVNVSGIVDTLQDYRDIIYGNHVDVKPAFRKYSITESSKYKNIPRTIQNVFLNSKLDAEIIKKTIIDSMTDIELSVNIDSMRSLISEFGQEYNDIMLWEKMNEKGELYVKRDAKNVVDKYLGLLYTDSQIRELCGNIVYAQQRDIQLMPELETTQNSLNAEDLRIKRLIQEEKDKYNTENNKILKEIGSLEDKIKSIATKKKDYQEMRIEDIIKLVESEQQKKDSLQQHKDILENLTKQFHNIRDKYQVIIDKLEQDFTNFRNGQNLKKNVYRNNLLKEKDKLQERKSNLEKEIRDKYEEREHIMSNQMMDLRQELGDLQMKKVKIESSRKYGEEIENVRNEIKATNDTHERLEREIKHLKDKGDGLRKQWGIENGNYEERIENERRETVKNIEAVEKEIANEEAILAKQEGSLFEWLEANKKGWENNIGKIADEVILYNTSLNPQDEGNQNSLFGVEIDLNNVNRRIRTPEEIKKCIKERQMKIQQIKNSAEKKIKDIEAEKNDKRRFYEKEIHNISSEIKKFEIEISLIPNKLKELKSKLLDWQKKDEEYKQKLLEENEEKVQKLNNNILILNREQTNNKDGKDRKVKDIEKEYRSNIKIAEEKCEAECRTVDEETEVKLTEKERQKAGYLAERDNELAGKGVDTSKVKEVETLIEKLQKTLKDIEDNKQHYYNYKKDKEELFDKEPEFRQQKKSLEDKRAMLDTRYQNIKDKHQRQKFDNDARLVEVKNKISVIKEGMSNLDKFKDDDLCPTDLKEATVVQQKNDDTCKQLVESLKSAVYNRRNKQSEFESNVNTFKSYFSPKNTFKFKTTLNTNEDYMAFAENLRDFIDNNLVETYKDRLSKHYSDILQRISKEMGDLMRHSSDIEKTISDINHDFEESNFAGVIKKISLKMVESTDRLMQLLIRIKKFCDENMFNIGEINIFSDEKERTETSRKTVELLFELQKAIENNPSKDKITLDDTFKLQFRIQENDNDTGWIEKISNVGSDGTDVLVKAMVNIMLINVFKKKMSRKFNDYQLHCMMDEIGKLHPANVRGILDFANKRNIFLINSSPISYTASDYRHNYILEKDGQSNTMVKFLMSKR